MFELGPGHVRAKVLSGARPPGDDDLHARLPAPGALDRAAAGARRPARRHAVAVHVASLKSRLKALTD